MSRLSFPLLVLVAICLFFSPSNADEKSQNLKLHALHVLGSEENVRLVLDTNKAVKSTSFLLSAPYRLIVDLENTALALQSNKQSGDPGFIKKINYGTTEQGTLRLVIESHVPMIVEQFFIAESNIENQERLVFDLKKSSEREFRITLAKQAEKRRLLALKQKKDDILKKQKEPRQDRAKPKRKKRIVIDPGHGGKDGGAKTQAGMLEKDIVLFFSQILAKSLLDTNQYDVRLTRTDDRFVSLSRRVEIARNFNADLFVSIHADSLPEDRRVRGSAIYTISEKASDVMAARIAKEQNQSDAIAGHEVVNAPEAVIDILFDLTRKETSNLSIVFARHFYDNMRSRIHFFKKPLQRAAFTVLRVPDIPSALIELGFLSNSQDAELLSSEEWRHKAAIDMAETISAYLKKTVASYNQ